MKLRPFRIEEYFAKYEFKARYLLCSSDAESRTIGELLNLEPGSESKFLELWCGYTESPGAPGLRQEIAGTYRGLDSENVLVISAAEEGIFLVYHALVGPGDHVIVETPCFESGLEVARSTGAEVSEWRRSAGNGWAHDLEALESRLRPNTRMIYLNTPHNPTGLVMPREIFEAVTELASSRKIILFCDEVYREMEHDPSARLPAACEKYEKALSLGSMSKTYGLPGLRLGWLASQDRELLKRCERFKFYTTICSSAPSEFLTALALRHRRTLVQRNLEIVKRNLVRLDDFFKRRSGQFDWVRPDASPIGFARLKGGKDTTAFCEEVVGKAGVLLLPGAVYDEPHYIRFGFGRQNMPESLEKLEQYLTQPSP